MQSVTPSWDITDISLRTTQRLKPTEVADPYRTTRIRKRMNDKIKTRRKVKRSTLGSHGEWAAASALSKISKERRRHTQLRKGEPETLARGHDCGRYAGGDLWPSSSFLFKLASHRSYIFGKHLSLPLRLRIRRLYRRATTFSGNLLPLANIAGHDSPPFYHLCLFVGASTMSTGSDLAPLRLTSPFEI